ncbi:MAG: GxxExxY protein [Chloroflexi bacterium]|nr:GxxExxY protein [Chloroflexota bacterium]MXX51563.1 GxxExxY protein [Chloroflexota bacterium]MXX82096.1 GxxExxY protein [Chloroflexota bacterium]MYA93411.1 GxxExxY protein [Chloroflexota bacterium]MYC55966.1 GxxExxY protein [Chloroflexota bacterium]
MGRYIADIIMENRAIVEVKSVKQSGRIHTAQLLTCLRLANLQAGLLINFNVPVLRNGIKQVVL